MARITLGAERFGTEAIGPEYRGLETGDILYFPVSPPLLPEADRSFLVTQKQVDASYHKNVSYRPLEDRLKGVDQDDSAQRARVHDIMRGYSQRAIAFMSTFLKRYAGDWKLDYASFRPIEESGRQVCACIRGTTCCISTRFRRGRHTAIVCCGSLPTSTRSAHGSGSRPTTSWTLAGQFADRIGLHKKPGALETGNN